MSKTKRIAVCAAVLAAAACAGLAWYFAAAAGARRPAENANAAMPQPEPPELTAVCPVCKQPAYALNSEAKLAYVLTSEGEKQEKEKGGGGRSSGLLRASAS